jgi:hypothetical protein
MQDEGRVEQAGTRSSKKDISPIVMRNIRQTFLRFSFVLRRHRTHTRSLAHSYAHAHAYAESHPTLLLNLSQNLRILEKEVFLHKKKINQHFQSRRKNKKGKKNQRTFSPTLIALPPQPGNKTPITRLDRRRHNTSLFIRCTVHQVRRRSQSLQGADSTWQRSGGIFPMSFSESSSFVHSSKPQKKERETHSFGFRV